MLDSPKLMAGERTAGRAAAPQQPRARGRARVRSKLADARSVIGDLHQAGSLKVVFPRVAGSALQAVTVNTAGGITGGDVFDAQFEASAGTELTVTTQAAERAYAAKGETGRLTSALKIGAGARLNWLPQETILFEASQFHRAMDVDLAVGARLLFVEPLVFGRAAGGETLRDIGFRDRISVRRGGAPLFEDAMILSGDVTAHMARTAGGAGRVRLGPLCRSRCGRAAGCSPWRFAGDSGRKPVAGRRFTYQSARRRQLCAAAKLDANFGDAACGPPPESMDDLDAIDPS